MKSVLQDWVMELPLRQQGVLILALRGPDGVAKESQTKPIVRTLRGLVMVSGREGKAMDMGTSWRDDPFMNTRDIAEPGMWKIRCGQFFEEVDSLNIHFYQHLLHAFQVCGVNHPSGDVRGRCWTFYTTAVHKLHMEPESAGMMLHRLRNGKREEDSE